jgi:antitoxin (DNA-binding transcriptional repressor) of toxin-antitoxin stability system
VTKRDKPVAKVVPVEKPPSLIGTVEYLVDDDELIKPLYEDWEPSLPE